MLLPSPLSSATPDEVEGPRPPCYLPREVFFGRSRPEHRDEGILRRVLKGGLHNPRNLHTELDQELSRCGALPGHARAFRSLCRQWRGWIAARTRYPAINLPVTLV